MCVLSFMHDNYEAAALAEIHRTMFDKQTQPTLLWL